jgi:hypothetical protein
MVRVRDDLIYPLRMVTGTWNGETFTADTEDEVLEMIQDRIAEWCGEQLEEEEEEMGGGAGTNVTVGDKEYVPNLSAHLKPR